MDLVVFGARGRVGRAFVDQALDHGHRVAALVRDGSDRAPNVSLDVVRGDVLDMDAVTRVMRAGAVVVSVLGGEDAIVRGNQNAIAAAAALGARRMLGVSGAGVLQADETHLRSEMPDYPARLRAIGAAHRAFYDALAASDLDWTLVGTPNIVDGAAHPLAASANVLPAGTFQVTTGAVAAFLLREASEPRFVRSRVGINGAR